MPKFYFHLSNCDERFPDNIGYDLPDVAAAHKRAKRLAKSGDGDLPFGQPPV